MRRLILACVAVLALAGCSSKTPPVGRWEGTYDSGDTLIAARMEVDPKGSVFVSAPDATNVGGVTGDDRAAMRQRLAQGLATAWGDVAGRHYDFDGSTFRKPGGIAPQMRWDSSDNTMTMYVYLGTTSVEVPLHSVKTFSDNPWSQH
ncbi:MAG: membrane lipoprotein lipid attachment site-containing protein [Rhizomicrobium sp.]